jgi:hypothetical protein
MLRLMTRKNVDVIVVERGSCDHKPVGMECCRGYRSRTIAKESRIWLEV